MADTDVTLEALISSLQRCAEQLAQAFKEKNWDHVLIDARTALSLTSRLHARAVAISTARTELGL